MTKKCAFCSTPADNHYGLAKIRLRISRRMGQWHEHLLAPPITLAHVILDDRVAAGEAMLGPKTFEYPLGRVMLLAMHRLVGFKPSVDDLGEPVKLRPLDRRIPPIARRCREGQHLLNRPAGNVEMPRRPTRAHALGTRQAHLLVKFHGVDLPAPPAAARREKWPDFTPPAAALSRR
jgi:hypothetical protein